MARLLDRQYGLSGLFSQGDNSHLPWPRRDGMEARTFRALIRYGFAREHEGCGCLVITDAGTKWLLGGKPENRKFAPDHLREEADVLDFTKLRSV